jgi:hypothetical protein
MRSASLAARMVATAQRRNFAQIQGELSGTGAADSVLRQICYPDSSEILKRVLAGMAAGLWQKESFIGSTECCETRAMSVLLDISGRAQRLLCFFPDFSARPADLVSDLPVLEIEASHSVEWFRMAKSKRLHFYFCSSVDLSRGMVLDVYEADPFVHQTSGPVTDMYFWGD